MAAFPAEARIAANRFGLGLRPDEADRIAADPRGWLLQQVNAPYKEPAIFAKQPHSGYMTAQLKAAREKNDDKESLRKLRRQSRKNLQDEIALRMLHAVQTPDSFRERLVLFWLNHFSVSSKGAGSPNQLMGYEREAIRPYVTGNFADMLLAVTQHPAMLNYLDNTTSFDPDSAIGKRRKKGLNENLAREILELHTLGVHGGYSQQDVEALAKLLTGWSINREDGQFRYMSGASNNDDIFLLGYDYPAPANNKRGQQRGEAALRDIAGNKATAYFLSYKLARHFIADTPPAEAVGKMADAYLKNGGELAAIYRALVELPEAWSPAPTKLKSSQDLIISAARAANAWESFPPEYFNASFRELGSGPYTADSPAGFDDTASGLLGSDVIIRRVGWAPYAARLLTNEKSIAPDSAARRLFGENMYEETVQALASTSDRQEGYAFLFASPDFQRR